MVRGTNLWACIEIKYTAVPKASKDFRISIEDLRTDTNFIITIRSDTYHASENITVCNLAAFISRHIDSIK